MWITRVSINNPVFATMVMIGIMVLGVFSYARLRVEQMPDVTLPYVDIETQYPGASPEVVETDVSKPIEYAVNTVSGVKRIYSNSREGRSQVFVEFRLGTDVTRAIQDARDKIALVRPTFPRDVKDPQVVRVTAATCSGARFVSSACSKRRTCSSASSSSVRSAMGR